MKIFQIPIQFNGSVAVHKLEWGLRVKTFAKATYDIHTRTVHCRYHIHITIFNIHKS